MRRDATGPESPTGPHTVRLYIAGIVGHSILVGTWPEADGDPRWQIALEVGVPASDVVLLEIPHGLHDINTFIEHFQQMLPTLTGLAPETWEVTDVAARILQALEIDVDARILQALEIE